MKWTLYRSLTEMAYQKSGASGYTLGLECTQSTGKKSHAVCGSLPSQLLSWLCNLLCGQCVSSLSQVVIRHAKCAKQKASANPTVNARAQRDYVDCDISVLCNYTTNCFQISEFDWWSLLFCVYVSECQVKSIGKLLLKTCRFRDSSTDQVYDLEQAEVKMAS